MKHHRSKNSEPSQRQRRVGEQLRHILSEVLQRGHFNDELLIDKSNTVVVSEVRPSPDLKHARAYVMSLNGENMKDLIPALNASAHIFQKEMSKGTNLKFTPRVKFVTDTSFAEAQHIENLLRDIKTDTDDDTDQD